MLFDHRKVGKWEVILAPVTRSKLGSGLGLSIVEAALSRAGAALFLEINQKVAWSLR